MREERVVLSANGNPLFEQRTDISPEEPFSYQVALPAGVREEDLTLTLFSAKGKMVFSEEYKGVIAETPHIKYRSSIVTWILLGLLVIILLGIMAALIIPALVRHR